MHISVFGIMIWWSLSEPQLHVSHLPLLWLHRLSSLHGLLAVVCIFILAYTLLPLPPPPHTQYNLLSPLCLWSRSRGMLSVSLALSLEIRLHHACQPPLHFIPFQSMPPKSCRIFIWAWWLWQIGQMTHMHLWTHAEGRLVHSGRDQTAPVSGYKTLPGWDQCPALSWTVPSSSVSGRRQDRQQTSLQHERHLQGSGTSSHNSYSWKCAVGILWWSNFSLLEAHQKSVWGLNLGWEWCCFGLQTIIPNILYQFVTYDRWCSM